jgi:outer membrane protein insertion porin family
MNNFAPFFNGDEDYAFPDGFSSRKEYTDAIRVVPIEYRMPYDQWAISLGIGTGYRWGTALGNLGLGGGFNFGLIKNDYDADLYRPFDPVLRNNTDWRPATSFSLYLSLDQRDIYYDPSRGYYGIQRFAYYGILRDIARDIGSNIEAEYYIKTDTKLEWFATLWDLHVSDNWSFKGVFGIHTGVSFIFPQPGLSEPWLQDKSMLMVDGMFNGRGWSMEYENKGLALWENWIELRIPLAPGILAWDFFFDAAGVRDTPAALFTDFSTPDDTDSFFLRFSFGGGLRFTIPQFPLRFSIAKLFKITNNRVEWIDGPLGGLNFVISFALATY